VGIFKNGFGNANYFRIQIVDSFDNLRGPTDISTFVEQYKIVIICTMATTVIGGSATATMVV